MVKENIFSLHGNFVIGLMMDTQDCQISEDVGVVVLSFWFIKQCPCHWWFTAFYAWPQPKALLCLICRGIETENFNHFFQVCYIMHVE